MTLDQDYSVKDVAEALGMSERWIRRLVAEGTEHQRYGHKIRFTAAQVDILRSGHTKTPVTAGSITTGRKRKSA